MVTSLLHCGTVRQVIIFGCLVHKKTFKDHKGSNFYFVPMSREAMLRAAKEQGGSGWDEWEVFHRRQYTRY